MPGRAATARTVLTACAMFLVALACGCRQEAMRNGMYSDNIAVVPLTDTAPAGTGLPARCYGPAMVYVGDRALPRFPWNDRILFEISNHGTAPADWVVWDYEYSLHKMLSTPHGRPGGVWRGRGWERFGYAGGLEPGGSTVCAVRLGYRGQDEWVTGGKVLGCLAGSGRKLPRVALHAKKYTGPEWLAPRGKFIRVRLDEALERLRAGGADVAGTEMQTLLEASRFVNGGLPVVNKPEIVAAFVDLLLRAERRLRSGDVEDEEPGPRVMRGSDPFEFCLLTLLDLVPPEQLRPHGEALGALSVHARDRRVAELLVKAGSAKALAGLAREPGKLPAEGREDLLLAARAASGDEKAYTALLERFAAAKGEIEKADLARLLATLGREDGLKAVAGQLRDTRTYERHATRSVRGEIADALRLVYPEEKALYVAWLPDVAEMAKVEEFCSARLGVKFEGEVPRDFVQGNSSADVFR